jgi:hypothetical protein
MKNKKPSLKQSISYTEYKLKQLESQYNDKANEFVIRVSQGVGLTAIDTHDLIRSLNFLYTDIAVHRDVLRSLKMEY